MHHGNSRALGCNPDQADQHPLIVHSVFPSQSNILVPSGNSAVIQSISEGQTVNTCEQQAFTLLNISKVKLEL